MHLNIGIGFPLLNSDIQYILSFILLLSHILIAHVFVYISCKRFFFFIVLGKGLILALSLCMHNHKLQNIPCMCEPTCQINLILIVI